VLYGFVVCVVYWFVDLGFMCLGTSAKGRFVKIEEFVEGLESNMPVCIVIGALSLGHPSILE